MIPTNPTLISIVTEGINAAGESNPSTALITRASNNWIEEIKNEIWHLVRKPQILQVTAYTVINQGQSRYAYPSDYSSDLSLMLLQGSDSNNCQTGTINTLTLGSNDKSGTEIIGKEVLMMSGTSMGSFSQIVTYDRVTKLAAMVPNFDTAPVAGDGYLLVDRKYPVETRPVFDWDTRLDMTAPGLPQYLYPIGDDVSGYFVFNCPPDKIMGARLRYYSDISLLDVNSDLMSILYRKWRDAFIKGVKWKKLLDEDDDSAANAEQKYNQALNLIKMRDLYGIDMSNITDRIMDYDFGHLDNYGGGSGIRS